MLVALAACAAAPAARAAPGFVADEKVSRQPADMAVLALAPNGFGAAAWVEAASGGTAVTTSTRPPGGSWSAPQTLAPNGASKRELSVAVGSSGAAAVAWQETVGTSAIHAVVSSRPSGGMFRAPETLVDDVQTFGGAVGVDGDDRVTLVSSQAPNQKVTERLFAAGASALAATPRTIKSDCQAFPAKLAVAPNGDAVAGFDCSGATFALRRGSGAWVVGPTTMNQFPPQGNCNFTSVANFPLSVGIDGTGRPVGLMEAFSVSYTCSPLTPSTVTGQRVDVRLVLPLAGAMTPVGGPPAVTESSSGGFSGGTISTTGPSADIGGGGLLLAWGGANGGGSGYLPFFRSYAADGTQPTDPQPVGTQASATGVAPSLAISDTGRALLAWGQQVGGVTSLVAATRTGATAFETPVPVGASSAGIAATTAADDGAVAFVSDADKLLHVRGFDGTAPRLANVAIPGTTTTGTRAVFRAMAIDVWGPVTLAWDFGDGSKAKGANVMHAYTKAGAMKASVTATDAAGNSSSRSATVRVMGPPMTAAPTTVVLPPQLTAASLSHRTFRAGRTPTALTAAKRAPVGTQIRYTLNELSTVTIALAQSLPGRLIRSRCAKPTRRLRKAKRCTRFVARGKLTRRSVAGANTVAFSGRVGTRRLRPGRYMLTLTPAAGDRRGAPVTLRFRIVR